MCCGQRPLYSSKQQVQLTVDLINDVRFPVRTMAPKKKKRTGPSKGEPPRKKAAPPACCPEVYLTRPPQPKVKKPGQLDDDQLRQFFEEGFVLVKGFLKPEELQPVRDDIDRLVDDLAERLFKAGKIKDKHKDAGLFKRLTLLERDFPGTAVILHKTGKLPKSFRDLWSNERLLNVMEQLVGPEVAGNPIWNLRTKTPYNEQTEVPWHQDNAYMDEEALGTLIPTAWIPLLDATVQNGCMQMVRVGHRKGVLAKHVCCTGGTWYVEMAKEKMEQTLDCDLTKDVVTCEMPYGSVLLFNNLTPHRSLSNISTDVRWSLDLRWMDPGKPAGLWGLKGSLPMRSAKNPDLVIDWEAFEAVDRNKQQQKSMDNVAGAEDEFDATIQGPWMTRWEIVHHNKHTRSMVNPGK
ncbi:phytanoyl-CoA dioxygenase domain-containing protein 1 homolog [Branchiostoma floridae x Branchiostoma belcheri]